MGKFWHHRDWWESDNGIDLWSVPHFLFGVLAAFLVPLFGLPVWQVFAWMTVGAILWEAFEKFIDIKESVQNHVLDVVFSIAGFGLAMLVFNTVALSYRDIALAGILLFISYGAFNLFGWYAHRRRGR